MASIGTLFISQALGATMVEEEVGKEGWLSPRWKALLVSLAVDLLLMPLVFVMVFFWPVFIMAIAPYLGGRLGGRYTDRRNGAWMGGLAALVMISILAILLLRLLSGLEGLGEDFTLWEPIGLTILALSLLVGFIFGALGGRHGAISAEEA